MSDRSFRRSPVSARTRRFFARTLVFAAAGLPAGAGGGCVDDGPPAKPLPATTIPAQPAGLKVKRVVFTVAQVLEDRDRNGYYDTIQATVYLFDTDYPFSVHIPGSFVFTLTEPADGAPIAKWTLPAAAAEKVQTVTWTGSIYPFQLDLRDVGTDQLENAESLIGCEFVPENGAAVECKSRLTVMVGRTR